MFLVISFLGWYLCEITLIVKVKLRCVCEWESVCDLYLQLCVDWRLNSSFPAVVVLARFSTENSLDMTCTYYTHTHTQESSLGDLMLKWAGTTPGDTRTHLDTHTQKRTGREPVDMVSQLLSWLWLYQPQFCRLFCPFPVISCRVWWPHQDKSFIWGLDISTQWQRWREKGYCSVKLESGAKHWCEHTHTSTKKHSNNATAKGFTPKPSCALLLV